jgi:hypothetical protein
MSAAPMDDPRYRLAQGLTNPVRWRETLVALPPPGRRLVYLLDARAADLWRVAALRAPVPMVSAARLLPDDPLEPFEASLTAEPRLIVLRDGSVREMIEAIPDTSAPSRTTR